MFPALEVLSLCGCCVDVAALVHHCPRVLRATGCSLGHAIRSASLQELVLEIKTGRVDIEVPTLKQLTLSLNSRGELRLSILAPMVEKVLWRCRYSKVAAGIGLWGLAMVRLETESNALCLRMDCLHSFSFPHTELSLAQEIEKHLVVTNFSVLDLHFNSFRTTGNTFGAFVFRLVLLQKFLR